ncbi:hypothetical protein F5887DRAFT_890955 [Amanita rubescens]|nr:hypothetical protein F5887DRAFT_890955 [Amanita rubescens]
MLVSKICFVLLSYLLEFSKKSVANPVALVAEVSTLRRHMQSSHKAAYQKWAETNSFLSMLPKDAENRRKDALANNQSRLDPHLREKQQKEAVIPYSDERFRDAAIEWLVSTDQPIQAFEHRSYQNMINIAARAGSNGVKIPDRRQTRQAIIDTFKRQLVALRDRLNVRVILHHYYHVALTFDT